MKKLILLLPLFIITVSIFSQTIIREIGYYERRKDLQDISNAKRLSKNDFINDMMEIRYDSTFVIRVIKDNNFQQLNYLITNVRYFLKAKDGTDLIKTINIEKGGENTELLEQDFLAINFESIQKDQIDNSILTISMKLEDKDTHTKSEVFKQIRLRIYHLQILFNVSDLDNIKVFLEGAINTGKGIALDISGAYVESIGFKTVTIVHVPAVVFDTKAPLLKDFEIGFIAPIDLLQDKKVIGYGGDVGFLKSKSGATALHFGGGIISIEDDRPFGFIGINIGALFDYIKNIEL